MIIKTEFLRFKNIVVTAFVVGLGVLVISIVFDEAKKSQDIRSRAGGGASVSGNVFCGGKEMCDDNRCVGETWRECSPCPQGKARSVYKVECGENIYSDCTLDDKVCDDK